MPSFPFHLPSLSPQSPPLLLTHAELFPVEGGNEKEDLQVKGRVRPKMEPVARIVVSIGDESGRKGRGEWKERRGMGSGADAVSDMH